MSYVNVPSTLAPLGWLPDGAPGGVRYPFDVTSDQRYVRPAANYGVDPFPWNWVTMGLLVLSPLLDYRKALGPSNNIAPYPDSAYLGGSAINVPGGMSFGFPDYSTLIKE